MALKRVFAGFYTSGTTEKPIFVVRVLKDIDTGESIVVCKDAKEDNEHYYHPVHILLRAGRGGWCAAGTNTSARPGAKSTKAPSAKWARTAFEPKSKPFTYVDDEYAERTIRCSRTYYEYAKGICENYGWDLRRYKLIREQKQYIGISNREAYQAMCEGSCICPAVAQNGAQRLRRSLPKRFSEELSIRKTADAMQQNRGVIERRQVVLYRAFAQLLVAGRGQTVSVG